MSEILPYERCPRCGLAIMEAFCQILSGNVWLECLLCHHIEDVERYPGPHHDMIGMEDGA